MGTFKGYPSVGDASLYLGLLPLCSEIFKCKTKPIATEDNDFSQ